MPKTDPVGVPLKASIDVDTLADAIEKQMKEKMKSWSVVIDAPYALSLEFGTNKASRREGPLVRRAVLMPNGTVKDYYMSETLWNLYLWAGRHFSAEEAYNVAYAVYKKLCKEGLAPHPFIRPALHDMQDHAGEYMKQAAEQYDDLIEGLANILADKIKDNIGGSGAEGLSAPQDDLGYLRRSIHVEQSDGTAHSNEVDWSKPLHASSRGPI